MTILYLQVYWEGSKIACFIFFFFVYRDGVLGLTAQLRLGWSSHTRSNTGVAALQAGTSSRLGSAVIIGLSRVSKVDSGSVRFVCVPTLTTNRW